MIQRLRADIDPTNAAVAFFVWLFSLVVYILTLAPTLSFWDCGEFIACANVLGIPHPPGNPLYIMIGRIFSVIPFSDDPAVRVNMLSAIPSAFTAMFCYLAASRLLQTWFGDESHGSRFLSYAGAASGALFVAFSLTNWNNAVETEVYGLSLMLMAAILWLTIIYYEQEDTRSANRYMLLIVYLAFLGIGVHLTTFLILPVAALFFVIKRDAPARAWYLMTTFIALELYLIFAFSSRPGEIPIYVPIMIAALAYVFYVFSFEKFPHYLWLGIAAFAIACAPMLGFINRLASGSDGAPGSMSTGTLDALDLTGTVGLVAIAAVGLYSAFKHFRTKSDTEADGHHGVQAIFCLMALLMVVLISTVKGYNAFLVVSGVLFLVLITFTWRHFNWAILAALASVSLVAVSMKPFAIGSAVVLIALPILGRFIRLPNWRSALLIILAATAGFSVHTFIPIRSAQDPAINENNPSESLTETVNYIERKQYMRESMVERMFKRRSEWANQFGDYRRMGFWRFFNREYGLAGGRFIILFMLGIFGIWELIRRRPQTGLALAMLLIISSIGLVLYMNFADGTRQHPVTGMDYMEVRDRGYFFTPMFVFFGMSMGIGLSIAVAILRDSLARTSAIVRKGLVGLSCLLFLLPVFTLASNYHESDRSRNYMPYDYAWNLLQSVKPDGILFTNGDNDTFPLWCLQEAYGIRKDVKVVNLSLANTKWYIKQIESKMGIELGWTEDQIDNIRPYRTPDGTVYRVPEQVINTIVDHNLDRMPIGFSVTVSTGFRKYAGGPADSLLTLVGQVMWMHPTPPEMIVDADASYAYYTQPGKFTWRWKAEDDIYLDETTLRLLRNYSRSFVNVASSLTRTDRPERAVEIMELAVRVVPHAPELRDFLIRVYGQQGSIEQLQRLALDATEDEKKAIKTTIGRAERVRGHPAEAEIILQQVLFENPSYRPAFDELMRLYIASQQAVPLQELVVAWLKVNPDDQEVQALWHDIVESSKRIAPGEEN